MSDPIDEENERAIAAIDEEIKQKLAANPGLLEELQEYDRRMARGEMEDVLSSDEVRVLLGLPPRSEQS